MNWHQRRVCVTGAGGFIGAHLCLGLKDLGATVWPVDIVSWTPSWRVLHPGAGPLELVSLEYPNAVVRMLDEWAPDLIYHLAGVSHIANAQAAPRLACETNIRLAWNILDAMRERKSAAIFIAASSNHVYGSGGPFTELSPLCATDFYGTTKAAQDLVIRAFRATGVRACSLRHVNCFGPADPHMTHVVTGTILALLRGTRPVCWGAGRATKAYMHVDDVMTAYIALTEAMVDGRAAHSPWWNASPGMVISVRALMDLICVLSDTGLTVERREHEHLSDQGLSQADYVETLDSSALRSLGWRSVVPLEGGLRTTWDWYGAHGGMAWAE